MSELPLSGKLPGMSSWDWLSEAAPGVALPVPLCCSCCLCGQAMTWINLLSQTKPNSSKKKKEKSCFPHLTTQLLELAGRGRQEFDGKEEGGQFCLSWQQSLLRGQLCYHSTCDNI